MDEMVELAYYMLTDIMGAHFFNPNNLLALLITIKQMYRRITYHNFEHAFTFTHCIYCILKRDYERFDLVEVSMWTAFLSRTFRLTLWYSQKLGLLFGGLCHDLDHPGYTNVFIKLTENPLASLYEDSILENHHAFVGAMIIKVRQHIGMCF